MELTLGAGAAGLGLARADSPAIPRKSPELAVTLTSGEQFLLSSLRGKVVAVEFLLTTCPHCQDCSVYLEKMMEEFGPKGFTVLGAAINDNARVLIPEFLYRLGIKFPVGVCPQAHAYDYLQWNPGVQGPMMMPQLVFVDRKGIIRSHHPGDSDYFRTDRDQHIRDEIVSLLKGAPATKKTTAKKAASKG
jgi:peroxiredoxin